MERTSRSMPFTLQVLRRTATSSWPIRAATLQPAQKPDICRGLPLATRARLCAPICRCYRGAGHSLAPFLRGARARSISHAEDQGQRHGRRDGWRRDDADHLEAHQGQADPALPRSQPRVLRPRRRVSRQDRRPGHHRRRQRHQEARRRRQVRDHHARRRPRQGVRPQGDVALAQRHHPQHPGRRDLPRTHHLQERAAAGARLDPADRHRPPRVTATSIAPPISSSPARAPSRSSSPARTARSSSARCSRRRAAA